MSKKRQRPWTEEETENFVALVQLLQKMEKEQQKMTEQEKKDNAIKMGDIFY